MSMNDTSLLPDDHPGVTQAERNKRYAERAAGGTAERRPRTDVERMEDALNALYEMAMAPGPDVQTQILNGIRDMKRVLTPTEDEA